MTDDVLNYSRPGLLTSLDSAQLRLIEGLPEDPVGVCAAVQGLVIQPADAAALGVPEDRIAEKNIRPVDKLITALTALDPAPLHQPRTPETRVIGTCRHFATIACAILRARGIASRARCGFGTYFLKDRGVDHWITEYWDEDHNRWVRVDTEHLGKNYVDRPDDLAPGEFLTGGEAWLHYRNGLIDPALFGVAGTDHAWGPHEISGNAVRDLAALCKQETLNWDEWGRMTAAYEGKTGPDYDQLIDVVADTCAKDNSPALTRLFAHDDLAVPQHVLV
ncbi:MULTISPECIES: transglutaminase-like domain-containing protein [Streptomyces]|uniref:Transglutaminase-like superfamily protein n=1 Tax=Streptomyces chartreusis NRRL 3882 TaxID=1079985 RepID=A0A2N9AZM7_STRCX|nr:MULTISPECIES: transglutaminase-like domain-containing protein [Streptomyces]MYS91662.1 transglutaminase [Streptomyces sp. SID5464]SOR76534.1 Transglutaminase-like superfamily protein [Streptomyces chartreusis NRRL 3882]SOR84492.1 Transglutaminase-like superfamily protein [Streptomyces chartreusis NRRL 3882]